MNETTRLLIWHHATYMSSELQSLQAGLRADELRAAEKKSRIESLEHDLAELRESLGEWRPVKDG